MLSDRLYLKGGDNVERPFVVTNNAGTDRIRTFTGSVPGLPLTHAIRHQVTGKGDSIADRHLIQTAWTKRNSLGAVRNLVVSLTIQIPRDAFTSADAKLCTELALFTPMHSPAVLSAPGGTALVIDDETFAQLILGAS